MLLADLILCLAQFFPAADCVVILEDGKIKAQGSWEAIKHKASSSIPKFSIQHQLNRGAPPPTSGGLNAQLQAKEEAQAELTKKSGDLELYCQCLARTWLRHGKALSADVAFFRVLLPICWSAQPRSSLWLHRTLLALHHPSTAVA